jgi:hypothetical protein
MSIKTRGLPQEGRRERPFRWVFHFTQFKLKEMKLLGCFGNLESIAYMADCFGACDTKRRRGDWYL